ncbi:MAG: glycine cleavage system protein GcvH [Gammaproteobacteria bacterium]|nr:glycine cleavage system protein GcvH [Gammaproteobacteria bacterium]
MSQPSACRFHENHLWCRPRGDGAFVVGMSDYSQENLGDIMCFELPGPGTSITTGESFGTVESVKVVNDLIAPLGGEVVETNPAIEDDPTLANTDPYGDGWLLVVRADSDQPDGLMDEDAYRDYLQREA